MPADEVVPVVPGEDGLKGGEEVMKGGKRVKKATVKQLKKMLKKAGLKTTGKRAALTRRAHKAHLKMKGGAGEEKVMMGGSTLTPANTPQSAGRRRSRSRGKLFGVKLY